MVVPNCLEDRKTTSFDYIYTIHKADIQVQRVLTEAAA